MQAVDTFTLNKIAGWVLFTSLLVFGLNEVAAIVYHTSKPTKPGMTVEVAAEAPAEEGAATEQAAVPIAQLLAKADPAKGQAAFKPCQACHTVENGGANKIGPNLYGVMGRSIASHEGFAYSEALKAKSGETWTFDNMSAFLENPKGFAPNTKMTYAGVKKGETRADIVAYLNSLSDSPQPLPTAEAQPPTQEPAQQPAQTEQPQPAPAQQPAQTEQTQPAPAQQPVQTEQPQPAPAQQPAQAEQPPPAPAQQPAQAEQPQPAPAQEPEQGTQQPQPGEQPAQQQ